MGSPDYVTRVWDSPLQISPADWNDLLARQARPTFFMRHEYLSALHTSGSATAATGWTPRFVTLWQADTLVAACPLYVKTHSYGEYVFDWAWADAYHRHGLDYYPKGVVAVPFTPVPGSRLLAHDAAARHALAQALLQESRQRQLSSLHLLFLDEADMQACQVAGLMSRQGIQFHWHNVRPPEASLAQPASETDFTSFDDFLQHLTQDKRKKIRQEQHKVAQAGVRYRHLQGAAITPQDWEFFYRCYRQTYVEHGNPPYLSPAFFLDGMATQMADHWLLIVAERAGRPMACSLIGLDPLQKTAYGRYWGALERVDCLHFDLCYHQPLHWCIAHGYRHFEGGAQGEHKLARALLPVRSQSAHWLAHPAFSEAVAESLVRERHAVDQHWVELMARNPFRRQESPGADASIPG